MPVYFLEHHKHLASPRVISRNTDVFRKYDNGSLIDLTTSKNLHLRTYRSAHQS